MASRGSRAAVIVKQVGRMARPRGDHRDHGQKADGNPELDLLRCREPTWTDHKDAATYTLVVASPTA